jgi:hypothetical protein
MHWPARIRDLSISGLSLVLNRPFEPGAGLAIEVQGPESHPPVIVLARVVHARHRGLDWVLGCAFVSPLQDNVLDALLNAAYPVNPSSAPRPSASCQPAIPIPPSLRDRPAPTPLVADVHFRGVLRDGEVIERLLKRVELTASWPLLQGAVVSLRLGGAPPGNPIGKIRVTACFQQGEVWRLEGTFLDPPPAIVP